MVCELGGNQADNNGDDTRENKCENGPINPVVGLEEEEDDDEVPLVVRRSKRNRNSESTNVQPSPPRSAAAEGECRKKHRQGGGPWSGRPRSLWQRSLC